MALLLDDLLRRGRRGALHFCDPHQAILARPDHRGNGLRDPYRAILKTWAFPSQFIQKSTKVLVATPQGRLRNCLASMVMINEIHPNVTIW